MKVEPTRFADRSDVGWDREESRVTLEFLSSAIGRMESSLTEKKTRGNASLRLAA